MKRTPLKSDPEKTAAFVQRGRENGREGMKSTALRRATAPTDFRDGWDRQAWGIKKGKPRKPRRSIPAGARNEALARSAGGCIMCPNRAVQVHHVLPKGKWPHLAKLADNLVGMCPGCHDNHERAHRRIPRILLPAEALALAEAEGLTWYIERTYPADGERRAA